ncbi:MAG: radical SAM family heme chaperone HemW [Hydrogenibacillus sp.]|nr:radical SAM family heme chaperone HemW [Hydrogenibacillus sp.]
MNGWPRHVYVHVPFCAAKCHYCDFAVFVGRRASWETPYLEALARELEHVLAPFGGAYPEPIETLYFGGGTPTALSDGALERLFELLAAAFPRRAAEIEVTIEANPEGLAEARLRRLKALGVNRVSFGIQSFHDRHLRRLGRTHTARDAEAAVWAAFLAGIPRLSIDLIYGLPEETLEEWRVDLLQALRLPIEHLSAYALQVEPKTRFGRLFAAGQLPLPDEDLAVAMYETLVQNAETTGFHAYEVSNFARAGGESRHNLAYWKNVPYFGFGPGAHGYAFGMRYANTPSLPKYVRARETGAYRVEEQPVTRQAEIEETMFMGLRLTDGVDRAAFRARFGVELEAVYGPTLKRLQEQGVIVVDRRGVRLVPQARLIMNSVLAEFLLDDH